MANLYEISSSKMQIVELSSKSINGRRHVKFVIHEIFKSSDEWQDNGISWNEEYSRRAMPTVERMSLKAEFVDSERDMPLGHGLTGISEGKPVFQNAVVVGTSLNPKIEDIELNGKSIKVLTAEAEIDEFTYPNFVKWLEKEISNGNTVTGSVEIASPYVETPIIYEDGYKETGRVPMEYIYSGYAIISIKPADNSAVMLELNNAKNITQNEEEQYMDDKIILEKFEEISNKISETNANKAELEAKDTKITELSSELDGKNTEIENLKKLLEETQEERKKLDSEYDIAWKKVKELEEMIAKKEIESRLAEMNSKLEKYSDEEKECVKELIEQYTANPTSIEVNSIIDKIKAVKLDKLEAVKAVVEQNSFTGKNTINDIFGSIDEGDKSTENGDLY